MDFNGEYNSDLCYDLGYNITKYNILKIFNYINSSSIALFTNIIFLVLLVFLIIKLIREGYFAFSKNLFLIMYIFYISLLILSRVYCLESQCDKIPHCRECIGYAHEICVWCLAVIFFVTYKIILVLFYVINLFKTIYYHNNKTDCLLRQVITKFYEFHSIS